MSGLGLEPRWLLNRCFTEIKLVIVIIEVSVRVMYMINVDHFIPCQVLKKDQAKERKETIEAIKVKEAKLEVDGGRCWKKIGLWILSVTGEFSDHFKITICHNGNFHIYEREISIFTKNFQRLGFCPLLSFLLSVPTLSLQSFSTTMMADLHFQYKTNGGEKLSS